MTGRSFAPLASLPEGGGRRSDRKEFRPLPASLPEGGGRRSDRKEFRPLPASLPEGGGRRSDRKEFPQAANAFTCNTSHP